MTVLLGATAIVFMPNLWRPDDNPYQKAIAFASSLEKLHTLNLPDRYYGYVVWSPDSHTLATSTHEGDLRFWDVRTGNLVGRTDTITTVTSLEWSPVENVLGVGTYSNTIQLIDTTTHQIQRTLSVPPPKDAPTVSKRTGDAFTWSYFEVHLLGWMPDGRTLVSQTDIRLATYPPMQHDYNADGITYHTVQTWDVTSGKMSNYMTIGGSESQESPSEVRLSPDGHTLMALLYRYNIFSSKSIRTMKFWDMKTGALRHTIPADDLVTYSSNPLNQEGDNVVWSHDGRKLAYRTGLIITLRDVLTGKVRSTLPDAIPPTYTPTPTLRPEPRRPSIPTAPPLISVVPEAVRTDVVPEQIPTVPPPGYTPPPTQTPKPTPTADKDVYSPVVALSWLQNGQSLATFDSDALRLWDTRTGTLLHIIRHEETTHSVNLVGSPNGDLLAVLQLGDEMLWNPATGRELRRFEEEGRIEQLEWAPNGHYFVALRNPSGVEIWGVKDIAPSATPDKGLQP